MLDRACSTSTREARDLGEMPPCPAPARPAVVDAHRWGRSAAGSARSVGLVRRTTASAVPTALRSVRDPIGIAAQHPRAGPLGLPHRRTDARHPVARDARARDDPARATMMDVPLADAQGAPPRPPAAPSTTPSWPRSPAACAATTTCTTRRSSHCGSPCRSTCAPADDSSWGNRITLQRLTLPVEIEGRGRPDAGDPPGHREGPRRAVAAAHRRRSPGRSTSCPRRTSAGCSSTSTSWPATSRAARSRSTSRGGEVTGFYAFGPTIGAALNVTLMSYQDTCNLGLNIDTAAVHGSRDPHRVLPRGVRRGPAPLAHT